MTEFSLVLNHLKVKKLCHDLSNDYILDTYGKETANKISEIVVNQLKKPNLVFETEDQLKFLMENLAISYTLEVSQIHLMEISRKKYKEMLDKNFLKDLDQKLLYLNRIFRHFSLPFEFNGAIDSEFTGNRFFDFLMQVLDDFLFAVEKWHELFDKELWKTVFKISIGIFDQIYERNVEIFFDRDNSRKLSEKAVDDVLMIARYYSNSKMDDTEIWNLFDRYTKKWTSNPHFLRIWGKHLRMAFSEVAKLKKESLFLFKILLQAVKYDSVSQEKNLLLIMAEQFFSLTEAAKQSSIETSSFFVHRYPASNFLKVFWNILSLYTDAKFLFDDVFSYIISAIINVLSSFYFEGETHIQNKLLTFVQSLAVDSNTQCVLSLIQSVPQLFSFNTSFVKSISNFTIEKLFKLQSGKSSSSFSLFFFKSSSDLLWSAVYFLGGNHSNLIELIKMFLNTQSNYHVCYKVLSFVALNSIDFPLKDAVEKYFKYNEFTKLIKTKKGSKFISSLLFLISTTLRLGKSSQFFSSDFFATVLNCIIDFTPPTAPLLDRLICSAVQLLISGIDWGYSSFRREIHQRAVHKYLFFIKHHIEKSINRQKTKLRSQAGNWIGNYRTFLESSVNYISSRFLSFYPISDYSTRVIGSQKFLNEEYVINDYSIKNCKINHFIVDTTLITFLEGNMSLTGSKSMSPLDSLDDIGLFMVSRGPHGKTVFRLEEDVLGELEKPVLKPFIENKKLPPLTKPCLIEPVIDIPKTDQMVTFSIEQLNEFDSKLYEIFGSQFTKILDWDKISLKLDFTRPGKHQRPYFLDFLSQIGLLTFEDTSRIWFPMNPSLVKEAIQLLDENEVLNVFQVPILHVIPTDKNLDFDPNIFKKTTTKFLSFLTSLAPPLQVDSLNLKTNVPGVPFLKGFLAFITPSMAKNIDDAKKLYKQWEESKVKVIFNETGFDLNINSKDTDTVFVIRPQGDLFYTTIASRSKSLYLPITSGVLQSAVDIGFLVVLCCEQLYRDVFDSYEKFYLIREQIVQNLLEKEKKEKGSSTFLDSFFNEFQ